MQQSAPSKNQQEDFILIKIRDEKSAACLRTLWAWVERKGLASAVLAKEYSEKLRELEARWK